jgi:hypothetical protein
MSKEVIRKSCAALALVISLASASASATPSSAFTAAPAAANCEGDACSQVTFTFDDAKQQYHAQNNSTDRWARVTGSNLAATASACLAPGKDTYLPLKSINGSYRADYSDPKCGEAMDE